MQRAGVCSAPAYAACRQINASPMDCGVNWAHRYWSVLTTSPRVTDCGMLTKTTPRPWGCVRVRACGAEGGGRGPNLQRDHSSPWLPLQLPVLLPSPHPSPPLTPQTYTLAKRRRHAALLHSWVFTRRLGQQPGRIHVRGLRSHGHVQRRSRPRDRRHVHGRSRSRPPCRVR